MFSSNTKVVDSSLCTPCAYKYYKILQKATKYFMSIRKSVALFAKSGS